MLTVSVLYWVLFFFFFKQKTAYEMRISDWSSDVCSSDLARGLRYTDFHSTPMCSPTRAALLTGRNSHSVGIGHVAHSDPGFPGYAMEIGRASCRERVCQYV